MMSTAQVQDIDHEPSPSSSSSSSSTSPLSWQVFTGEEQSLANQGIKLFMTNRFLSATSLASSKCEESPRLALLNAIMSFLKASSTHSDSDISDSLALIWRMEKLGANASSSSSSTTALTLSGQLLQADTHLLGAILQLISQSYVKAAWNIRKSYRWYTSVKKALSSSSNITSIEKEELLAWCEFGVGMFNLLISLLPSTVIKIAEWIGFTGDRVTGLRELHSSVSRDSWMSSFSCLLLLNYYVVISVFTGEQTPLYWDAAIELLEWANNKYDKGILFMFMESRLLRCQKDLRKAIQVADQAVVLAYELPSVSVLFHFQKAWCAFFLLEFKETALYLDQLLLPVKISKKTQTIVVDTHRSSLSHPNNNNNTSNNTINTINNNNNNNGGTYEDDEYIYVPPAPASAQAFYSYHAALCHAVLGDESTAIQYFKKVPTYMQQKKPKPIDLYADRKATECLARTRFLHEDYLLDAIEMIIAWNGCTQMNQEILNKTLHLLETASDKEKKGEFKWEVADRSRCDLFRASFYRALERFEEAKPILDGLMNQTSVLDSNKRAIANGTSPFIYHELAADALARNELDKAQTFLTKAQSYKNYDLFNALQIRLHALNSTIKAKRKTT